IDLGKCRERSAISAPRLPFLSAAITIIEKLERFWPLSVRQIHYYLLNDPPLRHASKPRSRYRYDVASYKALVNLLTQARHEGRVDWDTIDDSTRPIILG